MVQSELSACKTTVNGIEQGFPTFWLLRPPKHQLRPPTDAIVPKIPLLRRHLRPPRGTRPPGWEPLV
jgi:hypothetical protein